MLETVERNATHSQVKCDISPAAQPLRLLDQFSQRIRVLHYSRSTENTYRHWIIGYIRFHGRRHPREMGAAEVEAYLSHLATARDAYGEDVARQMGQIIKAKLAQRRAHQDA